MIQLNYRDAKPICEQVKIGIRKMVYSNVLSADEKLPSVKELASKLAINPNTIARAYAELAQEGFLHTQADGSIQINKSYIEEHTEKEELYEQFDEITKKLFSCFATAEELSARVYSLSKGGKESDSSK